MKKNLLNQAQLLGGNIYQDTTNQWIIELFINNEKLLLQEQESDKWLWISKKIPQALLTTEETLKILIELTKNGDFNRLKVKK